MIRVAIAGSSGMLRTGLESLVRTLPEFELAVVADAIEDITAQSGDVLVVLDPAFEADLDALAATPPAILIAAAVTNGQLRAAVRAGVRAVLPVDCTSAELGAAIQACAAGLAALRPVDLEAVISQPVSEVRAADFVQLTPRELEVLRLLADGLANKEISYRLGISEHTVKFHVTSILNRMNAATRAEAVAIGIRQGFILL